MAQVTGVDKAMAGLRKRLQVLTKGDNNPSVIVGFEAAYALYVHENKEQRLKGQPRPSGIGVYWGPKGQPKFLEEPARTKAPQMRAAIDRALKAELGVEQALLAAGLVLQREAQKLVPVEYGVLKASAFTRVEGRS